VRDQVSHPHITVKISVKLISEDEMGGDYSTHGRDEKLIQYFG